MEEKILDRKSILISKSMQIPFSGCWIWMSDSVKGGYGRSYFNGKKWLAHRLSYTLFEGEIKEGLTIDHLCKNPSCINPKHLEPVRMKENIMRGTSFSSINAKKTHCKNNHLFNEENTYRHKDGRRECKICIKARYINNYKNKKNDK